MGLVAPRHVGSSRTRARTRVPCIGRWILNHYATREAPLGDLKPTPGGTGPATWGGLGGADGISSIPLGNAGDTLMGASLPDCRAGGQFLLRCRN